MSMIVDEEKLVSEFKKQEVLNNSIDHFFDSEIVGIKLKYWLALVMLSVIATSIKKISK